MTSRVRKPPTEKTVTAGDALVDSILGNLPTVEDEPYPLDARELAVLEIIRAVANDVAALEAKRDEQELFITGSKGQQRLNPLWSEIRLQRTSLRAHIESLQVPTDRDLELRSRSRKSPRHQRAANARWAREARVESWVARPAPGTAKSRWAHLNRSDVTGPYSHLSASEPSSVDRFDGMTVESLDPK